MSFLLLVEKGVTLLGLRVIAYAQGGPAPFDFHAADMYDTK